MILTERKGKEQEMYKSDINARYDNRCIHRKNQKGRLKQKKKDKAIYLQEAKNMEKTIRIDNKKGTIYNRK